MKKITILIKGGNIYAKIDGYKMSLAQKLHKSIRKLMNNSKLIEYHSKMNRFYDLLKPLKVRISMCLTIIGIESVTHKNWYPYFTKKLALTILNFIKLVEKRKMKLEIHTNNIYIVIYKHTD